MAIQIRPATAADAPAMAMISRASLNTEMDEARLRHLLLAKRGFTFVADSSDRVVGFADYFLTLSQNDDIRLELDLLAAHPQARGKGIGRRLIHVSIEQAKCLGVSSIRALVAADNTAMQGLCAALGFQPSQDNSALFVTARRPRPPSCANKAQACLIPVETLTYDGIWIEGDIDQTAIDNALFIAHARQLATVGAVVSSQDAAAQSLFRANHFACLGKYDWWTFNL